MSILLSIKKFFSAEKQTSKPEQEKTQIEFKDLGIKLEELSKETEEREKCIEEEIKKKAGETSEKLKKQLVVLKNISLKERKETEKLKFIVMENLAFYISNLEKFSEYLGKKQGIDGIKAVVVNFNNHTKNNFEKASILIGSQLEDVRESIKEFVKDFNSIIESNREFFEKKKKILELKALLLKINEFEERGRENKREIGKKEEEKERLIKEKTKKTEEVNELKETKEYKKIEVEKTRRVQEKEAIREKAFKAKEKYNCIFLTK